MTVKLTQAQEVEAFRLMKNGGPDGERAREQFVFCNQRLVSSRAKRFRDKGLTWEELMAAGNVGLLQAMNRFDSSRRYKFSTFAVPWIDGEIKQAFASTKKQKHSDGAIAQSEACVPLVFEQSEEEVVEETPSEEVVHDPLFDWGDSSPTADAQEVEILNSQADKGEGISLKEAVSEGATPSTGCAEFGNLRGEDSSDVSRGMDAITDRIPNLPVDGGLIEEAIQRLEARQAQVVAMHFGLLGHKQHTFAEIGQALGVSTQRAEAIQRAAFTRLREDPELVEMLSEIQ